MVRIALGQLVINWTVGRSLEISDDMRKGERKRGVLRETEEMGGERERRVLNFFCTDWLIPSADFEIF